MKKIFLLACAALLAACQTTTTGVQQAADTAARICPPLRTVVHSLSVSPAIAEETRHKLTMSEPVIAAACVGTETRDIIRVVNEVAPLAIDAVAVSTLSEEDQQRIILVIITIQAIAEGFKQ